MIRQILLSAAALTAMAGVTLAADLPNTKAPPVFTPPPPPVFSWTGFYVGAQIGFQWGNQSAYYTAPAGAVMGEPGLRADGVVGGLHVGYNYQVAQFVFGVEGDGEGSSYRGSGLDTTGTIRGSIHMPVEASVRGRVGWAWDRVLIYGTGGVAFASIQNTSTTVAAGPAVLAAIPVGAYDSAWSGRVGWTAGGGVEYAIDDNWSVRAEYRYTDYGPYNFVLTNTGAGGVLRVHPTDNRVEAGFSYKFDTFAPPAPVVAKY